MMVPYSYLPQQFADADDIWAKIRPIVAAGDFTLGREVELFEEEFAEFIGTRYAIGVGNGTDAITLSLKALGIRGEVITTPFTFVATVAAIIHAGATPVFADVRRDFNIDPAAIEAAITPRTEAILPVHWAGRACDMTTIKHIAAKHQLAVIEDCAHAHGSAWAGRRCGSWGDAGTFSLHPLKTLNVWGDGGIITTNYLGDASKLRRLRNHGLVGRDFCHEFAHNSRLDTVQAVVARHGLAKIEQTIAARAAVAVNLDSALGYDASKTSPWATENHYLYSFLAERRNELAAHLVAAGIEAKVHYPVPVHLQPAAEHLGHRRGAFPEAEYCADHTISLPAHEFITNEQIAYMAETINGFRA